MHACENDVIRCTKPMLKIRPMTVAFWDLQASDSDKVEWFIRKQKIVQESASVFVEEKTRIHEEELEQERLRVAKEKEEQEAIEREKVSSIALQTLRNSALLTKT